MGPLLTNMGKLIKVGKRGENQPGVNRIDTVTNLTYRVEVSLACLFRLYHLSPHPPTATTLPGSKYT